MDFNQMGKYLYGLIMQKYHLENKNIGSIPDYLAKHGLLNDNTIAYLINIINASPEEIKNLIIKYLANLYVSIQLDEEDSIKIYLKEADLNSIVELYDSEKSFKEVLLNNFFISIYLDKWNLERNEPELSEDEDYIIEMLPDKIRNEFEYVASTLMIEGDDIDEVASKIIIMLDISEKANSNDKTFNEAVEFIERYSYFLIRIILADTLLYTNANIEEKDFKKIRDYIVSCCIEDDYCFPEDDKMAEKIVECFIMLLSDNETRIALKNNADNEIKSLYDEINFLSPFEEQNPSRN